MALRSKAKSVCGLSSFGLLVALGGAFGPSVAAQNYTYEVRHQHWHGGALGTLRISPEGISFEEHGTKGKTDSREWHYEELQQITVSSSELRLLTYEDSKWRLGRDCEYIFDHVPKSLAVDAYPAWAAKLDQRFVAAFSDYESTPEWKGGAKLDRGLSGTLGTLMLEKERIVFDSGERSGSRSWRLTDIENVSSSGPLDLTVTTTEKSGLFRGGSRQFHFQLQQPLKEDQYSAIWRRVNRSKGLTFLDSGAAE